MSNGSVVFPEDKAAKAAAQSQSDQDAIDAMMAQRPGYLSSTDANGNLLSQYAIDPSKLPQATMDQQGIDAIRQRALAAPGTSAWYQLMMQQQGVNQKDQMDAASANADSSTAQAQSQLASQGGLSEGAAERVAMMGGRNSMMARQQASRQGELDRGNIGIQDNQQQTAMLQALPQDDYLNFQAEANNRDFQANADKFNTTTALQDKQSQSADNLAAFQEKMKAWAAGKTADATANSGK